MPRRFMTLAVPAVGLTLLLSGCARSDSTAPTTAPTTVPESSVPESTVPESTVPESTVPESTVPDTSVTTTLPVVEVTSPEAVPTTIDAPDAVVPPEPTAPPDSFAIGKETPRDPKGRPFLSPGDQGDDVVAMQRRLIQLGQRVDDSGVYDDATLAAVLTFQKSQGLVTDGIVGTRTWRALDTPRPPAPSTTTTLPRDPTAGATGDGAALPSVDAPTNDPAEIANSRITEAVVSLATQRVTLYAGKRPVATYLVSSGRNGLTPVGTFRVQSKSSRTVSNSDSSIGMKWMTRFNGGVGFHGIPVKAGRPLPTPLGQRPVSAGCVRMADADAKAVYDRLPVGAVVVVR